MPLFQATVAICMIPFIGLIQSRELGWLSWQSPTSLQKPGNLDHPQTKILWVYVL